MARSILYDKLRWLLHERPRGVVIGYTHRISGGSTVIREISLDEVESADKWALSLKDGWTVIPLHRIVYIKKEDGMMLYSREKPGKD